MARSWRKETSEIQAGPKPWGALAANPCKRRETSMIVLFVAVRFNIVPPKKMAFAATIAGRFPTFVEIGFQKMQPRPRNASGATVNAISLSGVKGISAPMYGKQMLSPELVNSAWKRKNPTLNIDMYFRAVLQFYINAAH